MIDAAPPTDRSEWLQDVNSFLVSAVCHLVALLLLGILTLAPHSPFTGISLVAQLGDGNDAISGEEGAESLDDSAEQFSATQLDELLQAQAVDTVSVDAVVVDTEAETQAAAQVDDLSAAKALDNTLAMMSGAGGGQGRTGHGGGAASGDGSPFGKEDGFFGLGKSGASLVYVVDCSDSMNDAGKWKQASYELIRSLKDLNYDQKFFVIFFSDGAYPMDADGPIPATYDEVEDTERWVKQIEPSGGTNPLPALIYAMSLEPDAIFFLSDGQFDPMVISELKQRNPRSAGQIPIHTVSFYNRDAVNMMRTIARQSGGKFKFVK